MWRSRRHAASASASSAGGVKVKATSSSCRSRRKNCAAGDAVCKNQADGKLQNFFRKLGSSIESLIDATPLGVPTPCEPWSPLTDKKKALLSNPISVLKVITEMMSAYSPARFINSLGAAVAEATTQWLQTSAMMLMGLRDVVAHAVLRENVVSDNGISDPPVIVESEDVTVPGEGTSGTFVDLSTESAKMDISEARGRSMRLSNFLTKRVIPFIDSLTLLAHGIVITPDDCSVECSLASLMDENELRLCSPSSVPESISSDKDDFEDCPSVVTEIAMLDELEDDDDEEEKKANMNAGNQDMSGGDRDDQEYVLTDAPGVFDDEDFVEVRAELVVQFRY